MPYIGKQARNAILLTLVIGGSFCFGILIYPYTISFSNKSINHVSVRKFSPAIEAGIKENMILETGKNKITIESSELQSWVETYERNYLDEEDKRISTASIVTYLEPLAARLNIEPVSAKLTFQNNKASVFVPSVTGEKLNISASATAIAKALMEGKHSASLVIDRTEPEVTLEKINDLGIHTLLAKGESDYGRSPSSRIHNIKVGMAKFNGTIVEPGKEFSFNEILGEVDEQSGYRSELVIKNGKLVSEYGGGICQVSTTFFRAAILAGLPITERKPHSFPVQYYNPQGYDSTIYPGVVDLRFINDTPNHILIQTRLIGSKLNVEIYGSEDGRNVVVDAPVQYDKKPSGAMKAYFMRKIYRDEQLVKEERFDSVYKAPPASPLEKNPLE